MPVCGRDHEHDRDREIHVLEGDDECRLIYNWRWALGPQLSSLVTELSRSCLEWWGLMLQYPHSPNPWQVTPKHTAFGNWEKQRNDSISAELAYSLICPRAGGWSRQFARAVRTLWAPAWSLTGTSPRSPHPQQTLRPSWAPPYRCREIGTELNLLADKQNKIRCSDILSRKAFVFILFLSSSALPTASPPILGSKKLRLLWDQRQHYHPLLRGTQTVQAETRRRSALHLWLSHLHMVPI